MRTDVKEQSEIGFDDEISDHFSEEPIEDAFPESSTSMKGDQSVPKMAY